MADAKTKLFSDLGYRLNGVVHIGAHHGEEVDSYFEMEHASVFLFEPNRKAVSFLFKRFAGKYPGLYIYPIALGKKDETRDLFIPQHLHAETDDSQSASLLLPDYSSPYGWGERGKRFRRTTCSVSTFSSWRRTLGMRELQSLNECNTLVVDTQGTELDVLQGIGLIDLAQFHFLNIECSKVPIYQGGAPASQVIDYLATFGYTPLPETPVSEHDDILFIHRSVK